MYHHLSRDKRVSLATLIREGYTQKEVAKIVGVHPATICRELKRNTEIRYHAAHAQVLTRIRRQRSKGLYRLIENDSVLSTCIEQRLEPLVSPEVVAHEVGIHHQTIYAWIYRSRPDLRAFLPYQWKKRRKYGKKRKKYSGWTKKVRLFRECPDTSLSREGDTIKGKTRTRLLTHVERTSLYTRVDLIPDGTADSVHAVLKRQPLSGTIIYDRGSEFALWQMVERDTSVIIFFADPHSP